MAVATGTVKAQETERATDEMALADFIATYGCWSFATRTISNSTDRNEAIQRNSSKTQHANKVGG